LKKYDVDKNYFNTRLPRINAGKDVVVEPLKDQSQEQEPKPVEIMRKYKAKGKQYYEVRYSDNKIYDCSWALLDHYDRKMRTKNMWAFPNSRCENRRRR